MNFSHIWGRGMLALARDEKTTPEEMAEAAKAMPTEKSEGKDETPPAEPKRKFEPKPEPEPEPVVADKRRAKDVVADAHRAKMHAALDRMLAGKDIEPEGNVEPVMEGEPVVAEDVDLEELRELLSEFFQEEEQEPEHQEGAEGEPVVADRRAVAADGSFIEPGSTGGRGGSDEARAILDALRHDVARSSDAAVRRAFNGQLARYSRSGKPGKGSYAGFAGAASTRAADIAPNTQTAQQERDAKLQRYYDARLKGVPFTEEVTK